MRVGRVILALVLALLFAGCDAADTPAKDARMIEGLLSARETAMRNREIGRASCRERV